MIEREILGCLLQDNTLITETTLQTNHFSTQAHQLLFQSMKKMSMEGKAVDKVTLIIDYYEYIPQMGGVDFITSLETNGNPDNFESYERQFMQQYKKREADNVTKKWLRSEERRVGK